MTSRMSRAFCSQANPFLGEHASERPAKENREQKEHAESYGSGALRSREW